MSRSKSESKSLCDPLQYARPSASSIDGRLWVGTGAEELGSVRRVVAEELGRPHPWPPHALVRAPPWTSRCSTRPDRDGGLTNFEYEILVVASGSGEWPPSCFLPIYSAYQVLSAPFCICQFFLRGLESLIDRMKYSEE
jgi:hypothetical protein